MIDRPRTLTWIGLLASTLQRHGSFIKSTVSMTSHGVQPGAGEKIERGILPLAKSNLAGGYLHSTYFWGVFVGLGFFDAVQSRVQSFRQTGRNSKAMSQGTIQSLLEDEYHDLCKSMKEKLALTSTVSRLIGTSMKIRETLVHKTPAKLAKGAALLDKLQQERRWFREGVVNKVTIGMDELLHLDRLMRFSTAAYGYKTLHFLGLIPSWDTCWNNREGIQHLTGVGADDIKVQAEASEVYRPGHFLCVDHAAKQVVLSIRGTIRLQDLWTDLVCHPAKFSVADTVTNEELDGFAHEGFLTAARVLAFDLHDEVAAALNENPSYSLAVTGHSLGGSVATLLALIWTQIPLFMSRGVHAYSFASPSCLSYDLARSTFVKKHATSLIVGDDVVCKLNIGTTIDLLQACDALAADDLDLAKKKRIWKRFREKASLTDNKLFPGGTVYHIPLKKRYNDDCFEVHSAEEVDPAKATNEIILTPKMFQVHLPLNYMNALRMQPLLQKENVQN
mmetsp:Transcript_1439/g.1991  ORF Transcript_1439/g.1991 Transcript_1439/m.1991 type:complete len:505 (+) Transcript_1439:230-1744(+)